MLTINEIFHSIQGESTYAGRPCVFVRLTACDLRCSWCDTPYAFYEGSKRSLDEVLAEVDRFGCPLVEVTGGEPLLQEDVYPLMQRLLERGKTVLLETGGHRSTERVPAEVVTILDVKCPGSGEAERNDWTNLDRLRPHDEVKFVIKDRADYEFARGRHRASRAGRPCGRGSLVAGARRARPEDAVRVGARRPPARARAAAAAQVHLESDDARCLTRSFCSAAGSTPTPRRRSRGPTASGCTR